MLPHRALLHVSTQTGTGRNWAAGVLARLWRGQVAASFDLVGSLRSGFNGELSGKLLAIVDEVREGARADQWEHSETIKKLITEECRSVNFKYGQQVTEFNSCRFLLFSNSPAALPLNKVDRRFEVTIFEGAPRPESYYAHLYGLLGSPAFVNDVAVWLGRRDIRNFAPGARARNSLAKQRIVQATQSEAATYAEAVALHWPSDIIANTTLAQVIDPRSNGQVTAHVRATAAEMGMRPGTKPVWTGRGNERVHVIRNAERWLTAAGSEVAEELRRGVPTSLGLIDDWRGWLDGLAARTNVGGGFD